jgi:uncharacterized protein YcnI
VQVYTLVDSFVVVATACTASSAGVLLHDKAAVGSGVNSAMKTPANMASLPPGRMIFM